MSLTNIVLLGMMVMLHLNMYRAAPRPEVCLLFPVHTVPYLCPHQTCFLDSICPSVCRFVMYTCTLTEVQLFYQNFGFGLKIFVEFGFKSNCSKLLKYA